MNLLYGFEKSLLEGALVTFLISIFSMTVILFLGGVGASAKLFLKFSRTSCIAIFVFL